MENWNLYTSSPKIKIFHSYMKQSVIRKTHFIYEPCYRPHTGSPICVFSEFVIRAMALILDNQKMESHFSHLHSVVARIETDLEWDLTLSHPYTLSTIFDYSVLVPFGLGWLIISDRTLWDMKNLNSYSQILHVPALLLPCQNMITEWMLGVFLTLWYAVSLVFKRGRIYRKEVNINPRRSASSPSSLEGAKKNRKRRFGEAWILAAEIVVGLQCWGGASEQSGSPEAEGIPRITVAESLPSSPLRLPHVHGRLLSAEERKINQSKTLETDTHLETFQKLHLFRLNNHRNTKQDEAD